MFWRYHGAPNKSGVCSKSGRCVTQLPTALPFPSFTLFLPSIFLSLFLPSPSSPPLWPPIPPLLPVSSAFSSRSRKWKEACPLELSQLQGPQAGGSGSPPENRSLHLLSDKCSSRWQTLQLTQVLSVALLVYIPLRFFSSSTLIDWTGSGETEAVLFPQSLRTVVSHSAVEREVQDRVSRQAQQCQGLHLQGQTTTQPGLKKETPDSCSARPWGEKRKGLA